MNQYEFVLGIILIVMVTSIFKARYRHHNRSRDDTMPNDQGETLRLREEVKQLKDRLHVLERIATDKENTLSRQIEELRDH